MARLYIFFIFLTACLAQPIPNYWTLKNGAVTPRNGRSVAIGPTVLSPQDRMKAEISGMRAVNGIDWSRAHASPGLALTTPVTYLGTPYVIHPSVVYKPSGWNGFRFWLAITPNDGNAAHENPSIYCSQDGLAWSSPPGLSNPVVPTPATATPQPYNSDPDLVDGLDGKLYLFYRTARKALYYTASSDGISWESPYKIRDLGPDLSDDEMSPAVSFDGLTWRMYTVLFSDKSIRYRSAENPAGPWSAPVTVSIAAPSGQMFWHLSTFAVDGQVALLIYCSVAGADAQAGSKGLYLAWSNDAGTTFTFSPSPVMEGGTLEPSDLYRASAVPIRSGYELKLGIYYTGATYSSNPVFGSFLRYAEATLRTHPVTTYLDSMNPMVDPFDSRLNKALNHIGPGVLADTFQRADNTAIGSATTGQAWTVASGGIGVSAHQAYLPAATNTKAVIDSAVADVWVQSRFGADSTQTWVIFRYTDGNNYFRAGCNGGFWELDRIQSGSLTALAASLPPGCAAGDRLAVLAVGSAIKMYVNGVLLFSGADAFNATATKHGLQGSDTTVRWINFFVSCAADTATCPI